MQIALNDRQRLGPVLGQHLQAFVQGVNGNAVQRQNCNRDERQHRIEIEHESQREDQRKHIQPHIHHSDFDEIFGLLHVINEPGNRFADFRILIVPQRQALQMAV
ncbi:hypothetical protein D3C80_1620550 [compost metagenome]